jgi:murein L,D-transpeptidase YcbB/YkuD
MTRRVLLAIPLAAYGYAADAAREVLDLIADLAAALSAGNATLFLQAFDPKMPGYAKLRENVTGLIAQGDVQSFIDPVEDEGDERRRVAQFDWTLLMHRGQEATSFARREQVLKFSVEKRGGKWWIVELEPIEFFAPGV